MKFQSNRWCIVRQLSKKKNKIKNVVIWITVHFWIINNVNVKTRTMTNTSHSSTSTSSSNSKSKKKFNQKTNKHQGGDWNEKKELSFKGLAQNGAMKGVVITCERVLAGQLKPFLNALSNQMPQSDYSMILQLHQEQEGAGGW